MEAARPWSLRVRGFLNRHKNGTGILAVVAASLLLIGIAFLGTYLFEKPTTDWSTLWAGLFMGVGTSAGATVVIEILRNQFSNWLKGALDIKFQAFFGDGSLNRNTRGTIILQADSINNLMEKLLGEDNTTVKKVEDALRQPSRNRLFKARNWVNACDARSARIIRDGIRRLGFPTPQLRIIDHSKNADGPNFNPFKDYSNSPYVMSMGLAFTETSTSLSKKVDPNATRFVVSDKSPKGDAVAMPEGGFEFAQQYFATLIVDQKTEIGASTTDSRTWQWLFPKDWDEPGWWPDQKTNDYAVIIRHRERVSKKQVQFMVAGFTENTTEMAGEYLVRYWEAMCDEFIINNQIEDFAIAIPRIISKNKMAWEEGWNNRIRIFPDVPLAKQFPRRQPNVS